MYNGKTKTKIRTWQRRPKNDQEFGYATGRIRVLEMTLLKKEELTLFSDRMTDLAVLHDILDKAAYPAAESLEERFSLEEAKIDADLIEMASQSSLPRALLLDKDYHNAKWMLKQLLLSARQEELQAAVSQLREQEAKDQENRRFERQDQEDAYLDEKDELLSRNFEAPLSKSASPAQIEAKAAIEHAGLISAPQATPIDVKTFNTEALVAAAEREQSQAGSDIYSERIREKLLTGLIPAQTLWVDLLLVMRGQRIVRPCDPYLIEAIKRCLKAYLSYRDLSLVDIILDKAYYEELIAIAREKETGSEKAFILDFCSLKADAMNYQVLLRCAKAKTGPAYLRQVLVPGGEVSFSKLKGAYPAAVRVLHEQNHGDALQEEKDLTTLSHAYEDSMAKALVPQILSYKNIEGIRALGREIDNLLMELARQGRRLSYGAETVAGFWFAKQMEVKNIRIMYASRAVDISYEKTLSLLRKPYYDFL